MLCSAYQRASTLAHTTWSWPPSSTLRRRFIGRSFRGRTHSIVIPEVALPDLGAYGFSYWALTQAPPPLSRAIHSSQMELVGGLFYTSRSLSHGSTSSAPTDWAGTIYSSTYRVGWASDRGYTTCLYITYFSTTSVHAWGCSCSPYDSYYSTSCSYYIRVFHHHLCFRVLWPCSYLVDTICHTCCSFSAESCDMFPAGPANCYTPLYPVAPGSSASTSAWPSSMTRAFSSNWGYYSSSGHYQSRGPNPATSGGHHRCHCYNWSSGWALDSWHSHSYTWGCIISIWD